MSIYKGNKKIAGLIRGEDISHATEIHAGIIEIATQEEVNNGTDDLKAVTPLKLNENTKQTRENIEELLEDVNDLRKNTPSNEVIGSSLVIEDSAEMRVGKADILGVDVKQDTYEGTNLQSYTAREVASSSGVRYICDENGIVTIKGDSISSTDISLNVKTELILLEAGNYFIKVVGRIDESIKSFKISIDGSISNKTFDNNKELTFSITKDSEYYLNIPISAGNTYDSEFYVTLAKDTPTIEPYVGGTSSPNINYPQKIKAVDGEYEVKAQNKNFWKGGFIRNSVSNGITFNHNLDGSILINGTATGNAYSLSSDLVRTNGWFITFNPGTYSFSCNCENSSIETFKLFPNTTALIRTLTKNSPKATVVFEEKTDVFIRARVLENVTCNNELVLFQIEEGTEATSYTPHKEQNLQLNCSKYPLYSENDKYIYMNGTEGEGWYVYNEWQRLNFVDITWRKSTVTEIDQYICGLTFKKGIAGYCTHFKGVTSSSRVIGTMMFNAGTQLVARYAEAETTTIEDFNNFIQEKNPYALYPLLEPTYTKITDEDFINQLNALKKFKMYKKKTYINVTTENEDVLLPRLDVIYYQDIKYIQDVKVNNISVVQEGIANIDLTNYATKEYIDSLNGNEVFY